MENKWLKKISLLENEMHKEFITLAKTNPYKRKNNKDYYCVRFFLEDMTLTKGLVTDIDEDSMISVELSGGVKTVISVDFVPILGDKILLIQILKSNTK